MSKTKIKFLLQELGFYNHLSNQHLPKLKKVLGKALSPKSPTNLTLPLKLKSPSKNFVLLELGGTFLHISTISHNNLVNDKTVSFYQTTKVYTAANLANSLAEYFQKYSTTETDTLIIVLANALQTKLLKGELQSKILFFGKNHLHRNLIGANLGQLIKKKISKKVKVHLINDGLINTLTHEKHSTLISLIVGTGVNLCLAQPQDKKIFLANLEMGDFDFLKYSSFDAQLDVTSPTPGRFRTEKLLAGAWHHQLFRIILTDLTAAGVLNAEKFLKKINKWSSGDIESYFTKRTLTSEEKTYHWVWREMNNRGAYIHAQIISELLSLIPRSNSIKVLEIGSLIKHDHCYRRFLHQYLRQFCQKKQLKMPSFELAKANSVQSTKKLLAIV